MPGLEFNIVNQPHQSHINEVMRAKDDGRETRTTPHVGNMQVARNPGYLQIAKELGHVEFAMVDTITGSCRDFRPVEIEYSDGVDKLVSTSKYKQTIVGRADANSDSIGPEIREKLGLAASQAISLSALHKLSMRKAFPRTKVELVTDWLRDLEDPEQAAAIVTKASQLDDKHRFVAESGRRVVQQGFNGNQLQADDLFRFGGDPSIGSIPNLLGMLAAEIVRAQKNGKEGIVHIGGADMSLYGAAPEFQAAVAKIVSSVVGEKPFSYMIVNKLEIIKHLPNLPETITTQYDML